MMINRTVVNRTSIKGTVVRDCEIQHLIEHNFVIADNGFVCVTNKLWSALMNNEDNQKLIKQLKTE